MASESTKALKDINKNIITAAILREAGRLASERYARDAKPRIKGKASSVNACITDLDIYYAIKGFERTVEIQETEAEFPVPITGKCS